VNFRYTENTDRTFGTALLLSAVLHVFLLMNWPFYRHIFTARKPGEIEITYLKAEEPAKPEIVQARRSLPQPEVSNPSKIVSEAKPESLNKAKPSQEQPRKSLTGIKPADIPKDEEKEPVAMKSRVIIKQPIVPRIQATASVESKGLKLIPSSYSQGVRNRIIDNLESMRPGTGGDVCVRFVISSDGKLKDIKILDERSTSDGFLRSAAFEAVKDASPFPVFPDNVNLSEITFTCEISFSGQ
jgi:TonB family protein